MCKHLVIGALAIALSGCDSTLIPYDLTVAGPPTAPAGPKIAALLANLKCELFYAANSDKVLPRYYNDPSIPVHYDPSIPGYKEPDPTRLFTLRRLFEEIEYVGEAQFQLDATGTTGASPSVSVINPITATTNFTLAVNGNLSEQGHRFIYLYPSIDFERLVYSPPHDGKNKEGPLALFAPTIDMPKGADSPSVPCGRGSELGGSLGIEENLNYYFIEADMNDIAVWPNQPTSKTIKIPTTDNKYTIGQIQSQIDFTITSGINGGPSWTLTHVKAGGGMPGLLNYSRVVKDTLLLTFIPVCIRQKYRPINKTAPFKYVPELVEGTPRWAEYLPPCSVDTPENKVKAVQAAHNYNLINSKGVVPLSN